MTPTAFAAAFLAIACLSTSPALSMLLIVAAAVAMAHNRR